MLTKSIRCLLLFALLLPVYAASGKILHDWQFNDRRDTPLSGTLNTASRFTNWDGNLANSRATGDGLFRIRRDGGGNNRRFDLGNTGDADEFFLVVEIAGWNFTNTQGRNPNIRFEFMNEPARTNTTETTAGMRLERMPNGLVSMQGFASGTAAPGGQASDPRPLFNSYMNQKLTMVTSYSKSLNQYVVHFRVGDGPWYEFFRGHTSGVRDAKSVRMRVFGDFDGGGRNYFNIERLYVSTEFPKDAPISRERLWREVQEEQLDKFVFSPSEGVEMDIYYYTPENLTPESPVVMVLHGVNRDADRYLRQWRSLAAEYGFLLIVPEFSQDNFPGDRGYIMGKVFDSDGERNPRETWAYSALEPLFDEVLDRFENSNEGYYLYGHSAGSQFVHRMNYFVPDARFIHAVSANAGWYTLPTHEIDFPYGLNNTGVSEEELKHALSQPMLILLGEEDNDPNHRHLRRAPEAMEQGAHRFARGNNYYKRGQEAAEELGVEFGWQIQTVPGVAHNNAHMAVEAAAFLFKNKNEN
ncbi:MAG: hypothetical protein JJU20_01005 [Opitutales bacterium]|nr:hypothetical protein [Opitutales bacterium]